MTDEASPDKAQLQAEVRHGLKWMGISAILPVWGAKMTLDFGMSAWILSLVVFGLLSMLIFGARTITPVRKLKQGEYSILTFRDGQDELT